MMTRTNWGFIYCRMVGWCGSRRWVRKDLKRARLSFIARRCLEMKRSWTEENHENFKIINRPWLEIHASPIQVSTETHHYTNRFGAATGKGKGKVHSTIDHEGPEGEWRYRSTLSLTSALDGVGGQSYAPAAVPPEKIRYPLYRRLGRPQGRSTRVREVSTPPGFDPWTDQPVASRCTD